MSSRARRSGGGRHFPVGRRRHVPVVDTGCGCRPRLLSLPSFLRPSPGKPAPPRSASHSSSSFFPSSSSTASFSSSSAATYTTNYSSYYSPSNYSNYHYSHGYSAATKQQGQDRPTKVPPPVPVKRQLSTKKEKRYVEKAEAEEEEDVGVAVEKESSDPRADFRESMVQMVVEMGLCDWDDLRCMLRRLLALNAPRHHAAILTAFAEVCAQLAAPPAPPPAYHQYRR